MWICVYCVLTQLIYDEDKYIGAGALIDNNVVVTAAHKVYWPLIGQYWEYWSIIGQYWYYYPLIFPWLQVRDYTSSDSLSVILGDWNPNTRDEKEEYPELRMTVDCVRLHPEADLDNTLANNVAVLRLGEPAKLANLEQANVASTIILRNG